MKIKTDFDYKKILNKVGAFAAKNRIIVTSLIILTIGVLALQRITSLTNPSTDRTQLAKQVQTFEIISFDEEAINRIRALKESNVNIESEFTNRNNPFGE